MTRSAPAVTRRVLLFLAVIALAFRASASPAQETERRDLGEIFEHFFEQYLELHPVFASSIGDHRYNDRLTLDLLPAHRERRAALYTATRAALLEVPRGSLSGDQQLHLDALDYALGLYLDGLRFDGHLMPIARRRCWATASTSAVSTTSC